MRTRRRHREEPDDAGLSLIELIVVVVIVGILSGVIVMILVNSWNTQEDVNSTTVATNEGQVYASSIERAVRNAEDILVTGDVLQVRTTFPGSRQCQSFQIIASAETGDAAFMASAASATAWTGPTISERVANIGTDPYFIDSAGAVTYAFQIGTESAPVLFQGTVAARNTLGSGGTPCW